MTTAEVEALIKRMGEPGVASLESEIAAALRSLAKERGDAIQAKLARVRQVMPQARLLREAAIAIRKVSYPLYEMLGEMADRIEALQAPPKSRREIFRENGIEMVPASDASDQVRSPVDEALAYAREGIEQGKSLEDAHLGLKALLRAIEALARRQP